MEEVTISKQEFQILKDFWAGKKITRIAQKYDMRVPEVQKLVDLAQSDVLIKCINEDKTINVSLNIPLDKLTKVAK